MITRTLSALSFAALSLASGCNTDPRVPRAFDTIDLRITSPNYVYGDGYGVSLAATVMDNRGDERPEVAVTIVPALVERAERVDEGLQNASFVLSGSGSLTFRACIVEAPEICDDVTLLVDDGRPVLVVDAPTPGEEIDDPDGVYVHGTAFDSSPSLEVFVNGARMTVAEDGQFEVTLPPRFGVSHIDVLASDALTERARFEMDVLYAGSFTPARDEMGAPRVELDDAVGIWLGQDFFDDGVPFDAAASPLVTNDVADIVEAVVAEASFAGIIPDPVVSSGAFTLRIPSATLGEPEVELSVLDDGVDLYVRVNALALETSGSLTIDGETFSLDGTITGSAVAYVRLGITKASEDAEVEVTLGGLELAIDSVQGDFEDPEVDAIFSLAQALLRTTIETQIKNALSGLLTNSVPAVLESVLRSIDHALEDTTLELGAAPLPPVTLELDGRMSRIDTVYRQALLAPLSIAIASQSDNVHGTSRGVARLEETPMSGDFFDAGSVQVGVELGFLNGVLHVLWSSGLLDLDVGPLIPPFAAALVSEGRLVPKLAPILRPPREGEAGDLVLSIGQLELELVAEGRMRRFGIVLEAGVDITVADNVITLGVSETPTIYVYENAVPTEFTIIDTGLVETLLTGLWPDLRDALVSGLAITLPIPPIDGLATIAPALAGFTLSLDETSARLYPRGELLLLDARFEGRLP